MRKNNTKNGYGKNKESKKSYWPDRHFKVSSDRYANRSERTGLQNGRCKEYYNPIKKEGVRI